MEACTAVVLARGLGTRMRRDNGTAEVTEQQARAAAAGLKAMIPDSQGRPFLDHILSALADAGVQRVVLVVAPEAEVIRSHYRLHPPRRVALDWAVQVEPRGTADALLAAEPLIAREPFLVLNADNLYPVAAVRALVTLGEPGLVAFDRDALLEHGNVDAERVSSFALLEIDAHGYLQSLVEKPDPAVARTANGRWVSMNLWRFDSGIFDACRAVVPSVRGELELPQAAILGVEQGRPLRAVTFHAGVIDLSSRGDIATVASQLGRERADP